VFRKVTAAAELLLDRSLAAVLDGMAQPIEQDLSQGGYFRGRTSDDGRIDWAKGAKEIHNLVRAVAPPYPGAFTMLGGQKLRLLRTRVMRDAGSKRTPQLRFDGRHLVAECADGGVLRVLECDVDNVPLPVEQFAAHFGGEAVALGDPE
jgi:methionyl-tRNA formyltransferase